MMLSSKSRLIRRLVKVCSATPWHLNGARLWNKMVNIEY